MDAASNKNSLQQQRQTEHPFWVASNGGPKNGTRSVSFASSCSMGPPQRGRAQPWPAGRAGPRRGAAGAASGARRLHDWRIELPRSSHGAAGPGGARLPPRPRGRRGTAELPAAGTAGSSSPAAWRAASMASSCLLLRLALHVPSSSSPNPAAVLLLPPIRAAMSSCPPARAARSRRCVVGARAAGRGDGGEACLPPPPAAGLATGRQRSRGRRRGASGVLGRGIWVCSWRRKSFGC